MTLRTPTTGVLGPLFKAARIALPHRLRGRGRRVEATVARNAAASAADHRPERPSGAGNLGLGRPEGRRRFPPLLKTGRGMRGAGPTADALTVAVKPRPSRLAPSQQSLAADIEQRAHRGISKVHCRRVAPAPTGRCAKRAIATTEAALASLERPDAARGARLGAGGDPALYDRWLGSEPDPRESLRPFPAELMRMWPISTRLNLPKNDDPDLLTAVSRDSSNTPEQGPNSE